MGESKLKKYVSFILLFVMAFATLVPSFAETKTYSDVKETDWFYPEVSDFSSKGMTSGYPDGTFRISRSITLGEYLALTYNVRDNVYPEGKVEVTTQSNAHWASKYLKL